jgi:Domain of unknown function (DUF4190)
VSDSGQWFDHQIADLSPEQRAVLEQSLRTEKIPATFGAAAVRTDIAYEARVSTLIDYARSTPHAPTTIQPSAVQPSAVQPSAVQPSALQPRAVPPTYPTPGTPYATSAYATTAPPTNSNAIVALILGIASLLVCSLAGPVAIVIGQRARREIRQTGEQGDGMALAGVITGVVATALMAVVIVAVIVLVIVAAASSN